MFNERKNASRLSHTFAGLIKTAFSLKISRNGRAFAVPRNGTRTNKAFLQQRERERKRARVIVAISQRVGSWNGWKNGGIETCLFY